MKKDILEKFLREQEKEIRNVRKHIDIFLDSKKWNFVLPDNYEKVLTELKNNDYQRFYSLLKELDCHQKQRLYHELGYNMFYDCLTANLKEISRSVSEILISDLRRFFNDPECPVHYSYFIFRMCDAENKKYIVSEILSQETITDFACYSVENDEEPTRFLEVLLEVWGKGHEAQKREVFEKIAELSPEVIASLFEETDEPEIVCSVLDPMEEESVIAVCQHITNLYALIEKSNFKILEYAKQIPVWDLDEEEWQDLGNILMEEESSSVREVLPMEYIFEMYCCVRPRIKEIILFRVLEYNEMEMLYRELSIEERLEMLDLMSGDKTIDEYSPEKSLYMLENAIEILSQKKGLARFEELYLANFKARLS